MKLNAYMDIFATTFFVVAFLVVLFIV